MATSDALLALLLPGPRHGYDLKRTHDDWFAGMRSLAFGQVYSTLARLQRDGVVQVAHTERGDGPDRVVYELTESGLNRVRHWLADPVEPGASAEDLVRKTLAVYRLDVDPVGALARQRAVHLRRMRALDRPESAGADTEIAPALLADHTRLHLDADLRWLEIAAARIREHPLPTTPLPTEPIDLIDEPADADEGALS